MISRRLKVCGMVAFTAFAVINIVLLMFSHSPPGESAVVHTAHVLRDDSFFRDVINVCMSCDDNRLMGLVTAINSIYKNSKYPVKFNILVTSTAYQILLDWIDQTELKVIRRDIKVFDVDRINSIAHVHGGREELAAPMNYARFFYTEYFPDLRGAVLHVDDDCIVQGDVAELSRVPLSVNKTAAFSSDCVALSKRFAGSDRVYFKYINFSNPHIEALHLDPLECSFNTGVYVFDADHWRVNNITQQLVYWTSLNARERVYGNVHGGGGSQPPVMIVFYRRYHLLNPMWNVRYLGMPGGGHYSSSLLASAKLLHWSGPVKPWHGRAAHTAFWDKYFVPDPDHKYRPVRKYDTAEQTR